VPATFDVPKLGYVFDADRNIRTVIGVPGSATFSSPLNLPFEIRTVVFLTDNPRALVITHTEKLVILDLETLGTTPIDVVGPQSSASQLRVNADGTRAALYDASQKKIFLLKELAASPAIVATIGLSQEDHAFRDFAIAPGGNALLFATSLDGSDIIYSWTPSAGVRFLVAVGRVSDLTLVRENAVVADSGKNEILIIQNVHEQAVPALVADAREGVSDPLFMTAGGQPVPSNVTLILDCCARRGATTAMKKATPATALKMIRTLFLRDWFGEDLPIPKHIVNR
jgi:hypothetical protein